MPREEALEVVGIPKGTPLTPEVAQQAAERLRKACREEYHPMAKVSWRAEMSEAGQGLVLKLSVSAGPRGRLREIRFTGNEQLPSEALRERLKVQARTGWWAPLLRRDILRISDLEEDRETLRRYYVSNGFVEVVIGSPVIEPHPEQDGFLLTWPIEKEGPVYGFGEIQLDLDEWPDDEELDDILGLKPNTRYSPKAVAAARERLRDYFYRRGHPFAKVEVEQFPRVESRHMDVLFRLNAGERPRLRNVRIVGNEVTNEEVIRREVTLEHMDSFDPDALEGTRTRLEQTRIFKAVDMEVESSDDDSFYDLIIQVQEKKTGRIEAGYVFGDAQGGAFQFNIVEQNLSLLPPFRGGGMTARASVTWGSEIISGLVGWTNPRIGDTLWNSDISFSYEDSRNVSPYYDQEMISGHLLVGHPTGKFHSVAFGVSGTLRSLYNINPDFDRQLDDIDKETRLTSLVGYWFFDNTDNPMRPLSGVRFTTGLQVHHSMFGGNVDAFQGRVKGGLFFNPIGEHGFSITGTAEAIETFGDTEETPQSLRYYLGGVNDMRAFEYRSVSPLDETTGFLTGGDARWWATAEYLLPVMSRLDMALYVQAGDVVADDPGLLGEGPVLDAGVGFLIRADNFPIRFDVAFPLETYEGDLENETGKYRITFSAAYSY